VRDIASGNCERPSITAGHLQISENLCRRACIGSTLTDNQARTGTALRQQESTSELRPSRLLREYQISPAWAAGEQVMVITTRGDAIPCHGQRQVIPARSRGKVKDAACARYRGNYAPSRIFRGESMDAEPLQKPATAASWISAAALPGIASRGRCRPANDPCDASPRCAPKWKRFRAAAETLLQFAAAGLAPPATKPVTRPSGSNPPTFLSSALRRARALHYAEKGKENKAPAKQTHSRTPQSVLRRSGGVSLLRPPQSAIPRPA